MKHQNKINSIKQSAKRTASVIIGGMLVLACVILAFSFLTQPQRSVANFCQSAKEEKDNFKANTSYDKLLDSFKKLDVVAPKDIHSDTSLIVKGYESITSDPSKAVSAELGMNNSQMRVSDYITKNCPGY